MNKQISKYDYRLKNNNNNNSNYCFTCVFLIHAPCFLMCMMFYVSFIWIHVYAFAIHFMVHCGSAFEPGASGLPYYCASICVCSWCKWRASLWIQNPPPKKRHKIDRIEMASQVTGAWRALRIMLDSEQSEAPVAAATASFGLPAFFFNGFESTQLARRVQPKRTQMEVQ